MVCQLLVFRYQLDLCKRAVEENIVVYLGTGCGKTHIAVLLMYELGHLIRKPSREVCVFLAPTIPLVRQVEQLPALLTISVFFFGGDEVICSIFYEYTLICLWMFVTTSFGTRCTFTCLVSALFLYLYFVASNGDCGFH